MSSVETGQMSAVETGQMTAAETSGLSQQKTSVPAAPGCPRLTQTMKSQTLINLVRKKVKVFCSIPFFVNFLRRF